MRLYVAIFFGTLSTVFVPLPEEATLLGAGYAARLGSVTLLGAAVAAWLAVMVGDSFSYFFGRLFLARLLRTRWGERFIPQAKRAWGRTSSRGTPSAPSSSRAFWSDCAASCTASRSGRPSTHSRAFWASARAAGAAEVGGLVAIGYAFGELRARVGRNVDLVVAGVLLVALFAPLMVQRAWGRRQRLAQPDNGQAT